MAAKPQKFNVDIDWKACADGDPLPDTALLLANAERGEAIFGFFKVHEGDIFIGVAPVPVYYRLDMNAGFLFEPYDPTHWAVVPVLGVPAKDPKAPPHDLPQVVA